MTKHSSVMQSDRSQQATKQELKDALREVAERIHQRRESREIIALVRKPLSPEGGEYLEEVVIGYRP